MHTLRTASARKNPSTSDENESAINGFWSSVQAVPGDPSKGNLLERVLASVIPVNVSLQVSGDVSHAMITLKGPRRDPLVNKFPGDWETTVSTAPSTTIQPSTDPKKPNIYQDTAFRATLLDPDSYWMPQADAGLCDSIADVADQTEIPRSARMPNIGYLQYLRTGIIPDDESGDYSEQHGTPFRLLSFAPSTEPSSSDRIDWSADQHGAAVSPIRIGRCLICFTFLQHLHHLAARTTLRGKPEYERTAHEPPLLRNLRRRDGWED